MWVTYYLFVGCTTKVNDNVTNQIIGIALLWDASPNYLVGLTHLVVISTIVWCKKKKKKIETSHYYAHYYAVSPNSRNFRVVSFVSILNPLPMF